MRNDKHLAIQLRREGKSYNYINKELNIAKSTLSDWFSELDWSQQIKNELTKEMKHIATQRLQLTNSIRRQILEADRTKARENAREEFLSLRNHPLFIAGIMLYWGEGDSKIENGRVRLANTNPAMIKVFSLFLQTVCKVPSDIIRLSMVLYPDLNEETSRQFWSIASGLPESQFWRASFIKGKHPTKRLSHGICIIGVGNRNLKEKILVWIKLFHEQFSLSAGLV